MNLRLSHSKIIWRKLGALLTVFLLFVFNSAFLTPAKLQKRYLPHPDQPYWFELESDLWFSEEFMLPGYSEPTYGKLEYPALAIDSEKNVYVAYDFTDDTGKEGVYLNSFSDSDLPVEAEQKPHGGRILKFLKAPDWRGAVQVSSVTGAEYRPRLTVTRKDVIWVTWSAKRQGQWEIYARTYVNGALGVEIQVTANDSYDFRPVVLAARNGRIWLAWERGTTDKTIQIVAKSFYNGVWSQEIVVERRAGYAYRPALLESPKGDIWIAWDHTWQHNTDVYLAQLNGDRVGERVRVSSHPAIDSKAVLTWFDGKLWLAWTTNRRGEDSWGIIRYPLVRAFDGRNWYEPVSEIPGVDLQNKSETQSYEYPTLTFDPHGRLYLFTRHDHVFSAATYENGVWSKPWLLDEFGWGQRGFYVHTAWRSANELWMARRDRKTIFLQKMVRQNPANGKIRLKRYKQRGYPDALQRVEEKGPRDPSGRGKFKTYFGDLHVHTAYSDGSGSFDELYTLYKHVYQLDFLAITDHDALRLGFNHFSPGEWAYLKALNEIYDQPGEFVTINGYEWTHSTWSGRQDSSVRVGHKNVYFKGGEESPFFNHHGAVAHDPESLFAALAQADGIAFPHHPPWGGMTWDDHDPAIQTNYEIVSIHGANEYMGNLPIPHRGGMPGTFVQDGLAKGKVFGLVGASDSHGLYWHANEGWRADPYKGGWTAVLLDTTLTRENVWQALKHRRNYATSGGKRYLAFSVNGQPMGSILTVHEPPILSFEVRASDMLYTYIIRNNRELFISGKVGGDLTRYRGLKDESIPAGMNYYYLRVRYKDDTLAWSSPIWVNYLSEEETK